MIRSWPNRSAILSRDERARRRPAVIAYRFGRDDLLRTRFAISPLFELAASVRVLRDPGAHSVHLPWVREARARLAGLRLRAARRAAPERAVRRPTSSRRRRARRCPTSRRSSTRVRATPPDARAARGRLDVRGPAAAGVVRPLLDDPAAALPALVDLMAEYWERAIAPWWDAVRAVLEADIRQRARHLAGGGALELFAGLHPRRALARRRAARRPQRRGGRSSSPAAGSSSCRPRSGGRGSARCSTRPGSRR